MKNISYNKNLYKLAKIFTVGVIIAVVLFLTVAAAGTVWESINIIKIETGDVIKGSFSTLTGDDKTFAGNSNTIYSSNSTITGNFNTIYGDNNTVSGNSNKIHGENNKISGNFNTFTPGSGNMVMKGNSNREFAEEIEEIEE